MRLISDQKEAAFKKAKEELLAFFAGKGIEHIEIDLSDEPPQADPVSGKFKHIYRAY